MESFSHKKINSYLPKGAINIIQGKAIFLRGDDIDTDRIIPARFLKCVSFNKLGSQVFADDRNELKGNHPFDLAINKGVSLLVVNDNFGCGSSREHAPQALMRWGIRGILGESFAEIFYGNCLALGIPCATADRSTIIDVQNSINAEEDSIWSLNIERKMISNLSERWDIDIKEGPLEMLTSGRWDATSQLISNEKIIDKKIKKLPYLNHFQ